MSKRRKRQQKGAKKDPSLAKKGSTTVIRPAPEGAETQKPDSAANAKTPDTDTDTTAATPPASQRAAQSKETEKSGAGAIEKAGKAAKANTPLIFRQTMQLRAHPDLVFRQIFDPQRRARWDPSLRSAQFLEGGSLKNGGEVEYIFAARLLRWRMRGQLQGLKSSQRGRVQSLGRVGPLDSLSHDWQLRGIAGGTEVTFVQTAQVRHGWARSTLDRVLLNMGLRTIMGLQTAVDAPAAAQAKRKLAELQEKNAPQRRGLARFLRRK